MVETLIEMRCVECGFNTPTATDQEIAEFHPQIPLWHIVEGEGVKRLENMYTFPNFADALAFTNKVGELAEAEAHHPSILLEWGKVTMTWWTHTVKGLHRNDFIMAAKTDQTYKQAEGM